MSSRTKFRLELNPDFTATMSKVSVGFNVLVVCTVLCVLVLLELRTNLTPTASLARSLATADIPTDDCLNITEKAARSVLRELVEDSNALGQNFRGAKRSLLEDGHALPHRGGIHFKHNETVHKKAWMHYEVVDGLRNEEVIMFVMSSTTKDGYLLRERVIAGARTWMKLFANVVVVIEGACFPRTYATAFFFNKSQLTMLHFYLNIDTFEIRYAFRHCEIAEYESYTTFSCHNEPTYLLSRECTNEYYNAPGICCKVDESINYLVNQRPEFFKGIKYMLHSDDDTYWRPDQALRWLAALENSGAGKYPLVANAQIGDDNNEGVWSTTNCKEIHTTGWYQPTMFNRVALERMAVAAKAYGNRDVCKAFTISQDIGIGIVAWMFQLNHVQIPGANVNGEHQGYSVFKPHDMAVHFVKKTDTDRCDGQQDNKWPAKDRYDQDMVVGCGDVGRPIAGHNKALRADMYDAFEYYRANGTDVPLREGENEFVDRPVIVDASGNTVHLLKENQNSVVETGDTYTSPPEGVVLIDEVTTYKLREGEKIVKKTIPRVLPLRGYRGTKHSQENDITKQWKVFGLQDCSPPGSRG